MDRRTVGAIQKNPGRCREVAVVGKVSMKIKYIDRDKNSWPLKEISKFWPLWRGGRCREVSIRVKCMDRRTVGTKNPGCYHDREVAASGDLTVFTM